MILRSRKHQLLVFFVALVMLTGLFVSFRVANAEEKKALSVHVSGLGSRTDASFYQAMYEGYLHIKKKYPEMKIGFSDLVPFAETVSHMETLGAAGVDLVLTELAFFEAAVQVAPKHPNTWYLVMYIQPEMMKGLPPNITSHAWRDEQGGYLSGIVAGMMTKTNKLGYIAGLDYPDIVKLGAAFLMGAQSVNPDVELSVVYTGSWIDVQKGYDAARTIIDGGADVIIHYSDECGFGVIDAAKERNVWVIGEVRDQSYLAPDLTLTSYLANHGRMFEVAIDDLLAGKLTQRVKFFGLQEGQKVLAPFNPKVPQEARAKVKEAKQKMKSGELEIPLVLDSKEFEKLYK